jgi:ribosomal protein S18 acetylase RimI-like enzyme
MHASLAIRRLTRTDLAFADRVRALAAWNQTLDDWERFLATEPGGCFLAEWDGHPAGTATTTTYGNTLAWIGMVLVHPDYRRRGIGRALVAHSLAHLRHRGVRCVKLDATPSGESLYLNLGFEREWTFARWAGRAAGLRATPPAGGLRPWQRTDSEALEALDEEAFGARRRELLAALKAQSSAMLVLESPPGRVAAFGLLRPGSQALYLGPVVADTEAAGLRVVEALVSRADGATLFWDVPDTNTASVLWAGQHGLVLQRRLARMFWGTNLAPGNPRQQIALAGPETG